MLLTTAIAVFLSSQATTVYSFTPTISSRVDRKICTKAFEKPEQDHVFVAQSLIASVVIGALSVVAPVQYAFADEIGLSIDAPTLFTGETTEICIKRGPLGKCEKTQVRTLENDNDKASKYMKTQSTTVKSKDDKMRSSSDGTDDSPLIQRLKQQTEDNRERNELIVKQKTIENDLVSALGLQILME